MTEVTTRIGNLTHRETFETLRLDDVSVFSRAAKARGITLNRSRGLAVEVEEGKKGVLYVRRGRKKGGLSIKYVDSGLDASNNWQGEIGEDGSLQVLTSEVQVLQSAQEVVMKTVSGLGRPSGKESEGLEIRVYDSEYYQAMVMANRVMREFTDHWRDNPTVSAFLDNMREAPPDFFESVIVLSDREFEERYVAHGMRNIYDEVNFRKFVQKESKKSAKIAHAFWDEERKQVVLRARTIGRSSWHDILRLGIIHEWGHAIRPENGDLKPLNTLPPEKLETLKEHLENLARKSRSNIPIERVSYSQMGFDIELTIDGRHLVSLPLAQFGEEDRANVVAAEFERITNTILMVQEGKTEPTLERMLDFYAGWLGQGQEFHPADMFVRLAVTSLKRDPENPIQFWDKVIKTCIDADYENFTRLLAEGNTSP